MASDPSSTRVEATVLRTVGPQGSLFELLLPPGMRVLSGELAEVDRVLDERRLFGPFRRFFDLTRGAAVDPDRDLSAVDVLEVPLRGGL